VKKSCCGLAVRKLKVVWLETILNILKFKIENTNLNQNFKFKKSLNFEFENPLNFKFKIAEF
jgi:hypothetical protein